MIKFDPFKSDAPDVRHFLMQHTGSGWFKKTKEDGLVPYFAILVRTEHTVRPIQMALIFEIKNFFLGKHLELPGQKYKQSTL